MSIISQKADKFIGEFTRKEDTSLHSRSTEKLKPECLRETVRM